MNRNNHLLFDVAYSSRIKMLSPVFVDDIGETGKKITTSTSTLADVVNEQLMMK